MCEILVWRAHAHECAWPLPPYVAMTLGSLLDRLCDALLCGASQKSGGGHCHGKHVMLALRDLVEDDALRLELARHATRAGQSSLGPLERSRLHADWPVVVARAAAQPGGRPLTARAALVLTGSLQACAARALRTVDPRDQAAGSHAAHGWNLEALAGLLARHRGMLRLLLALDSDDAEPCARSAELHAENATCAHTAGPPSRPGGEHRAPPRAGEAVQTAVSDQLGPPPPPVWLDELLELRKERVLLQKHNQRLQDIVDGMLSPYGNLQPWVEWWSTMS